MERSMFRFIWRYSRGQQLAALALTALSLPFLYASFELPKTIINGAIDAERARVTVAGQTLSQLEYLLVLCGIFLALVLVNGLFKMKINTFKGVMAERLLRRLRFQLIARTLRFPLPQFQKTSSGEVVTMVTAEVEPLGGFFGDAFALVAFQGGTFLTILAFMFAQDPYLGLAAVALIPVQATVIPRLQAGVNRLGKERVQLVRSLSSRLGEVADGVEELRAQGAARHALADVSRRLGRIFDVRFEIYRRKFFMKFLNNFINQLTPFFFYAIGGWLVIRGDLSFGALVAALAAYKDLAPPWRELLNYYQRLADARIKYDQLIAQFEPPGLTAEPHEEAGGAGSGSGSGGDAATPALAGPLSVEGLTWADEDGVRVVDGATLTLPAGAAAAVTAPGGSARDVLGRLLARLLTPTAGRVVLGETDLTTLPEAAAGARIGYAAADPAFFNGTVADNMFLGLQRAPPPPGAESADAARRHEIAEAEAAGNSPFAPDADWTDYALAGVDGPEDLAERAIDLLEAVEMAPDMYAIGLRQTIDPAAEPALAEAVVAARRRIREALDARGMADLVQPYDSARYNTYSSVAENILFGQPTTPDWDLAAHPDDPGVRELLDAHDLTERFYEIGLACAELAVDLFRDLPAGHPFFADYGFVEEARLPELTSIVRRLRRAESAAALRPELSDAEFRLVVGLPLGVNVQRHRLEVIDAELQARIVALRHALRDAHPDVFRPGGAVEPFDAERYNPGLSLIDNMLFGRIVHGRGDATERVEALVAEICRDLRIDRAIVRIAFGFPVGNAGTRLSLAQRQKIGLVRNLLKRPDLLVAVEATNALDGEARARVAGRLHTLLPEAATLVWIAGAPEPGLAVDRSFELRGGRLVEHAAGAGEPAAETGATAAGPAGAEATPEAELSADALSLQQIPLFAGLAASRLKFLAFASARRSYAPGEIIMREGEEGDAAYVVLDGTIEVLTGAEGAEQVLFELGPNRIVGELALLDDTRRTATVRARTPTTALRINREVFTEFARQDAEFTFEMTRELARRLIVTTDELTRARARAEAPDSEG